MPITGSYGTDSGRRGQATSGGSTGVPQADGGLDTNAQIVFEIPTTTYYTRAIGEGNLTVFERENLGKAIPSPADMTGAIGVSADGLLAWTYTESLSNESRVAAASGNETYANNSQSDTRRDFSKGHGAAPPTQLAPEQRTVGSADHTALPAKNPDSKG